MTSSTEEVSEFSINEVLYMGSESLTYLVDHMLAETRDPFDIVAELEAAQGRPLAFD
jgi:hypothetical protein